MDSFGDPADVTGVAERQVETLSVSPDRRYGDGTIRTDLSCLTSLVGVGSHPAQRPSEMLFEAIQNNTALLTDRI